MASVDPNAARRAHQRRKRLQRTRRRRLAGVIVLLAGGATTWALTRSGTDAPAGAPGVANAASTPTSVPGGVTGGHEHVALASVATRTHLVARATGLLASPREGASATRAPDGSVILLGGIGSSGSAPTEIHRLMGGHDIVIGRLPSPLHDTAAATIGGSVYLFGGGNSTERDSIIRVNPVTGGAVQVGRLPRPSSDLTAAVIGDTVYLVGGYDGSRWFDGILAWRPGHAAKVVAHLPQAVRYAAVASAGNRLVIAGGSSPSTALDTVQMFNPSNNRVTTIGHLAIATTHAAAAALNGIVYLVGGRGATTGTPTRRIVAIDPTAGTIQPAGQLPRALSDLTAVSAGARIVLAGGKSANAATSFLGDLRLVASPVASGASAPPATAAAVGDVYAATRVGMLSPTVRGVRERVYVPNSQSGSVDVIDAATKRVVGHYPVGKLPQHVTPSWDLKTLWVNSNQGNSLTPFNPRTGKPAGPPVPVEDPYNLYFTPTGSDAIVVAERLDRLDFRDPHTMALRKSLPIPCRGPNHMDFTADGREALLACEFSGQLIHWDVARKTVLGAITIPNLGSMPQDVKLSPDGRIFYVADMHANGTWIVDASTFKLTRLIPTGAGAHGLYPSRDGKYLYVSNRDDGTISLIAFATRAVVKTWKIPGGSPDMGGVSADGKTLWLSGRSSGEVYAINTATGALRARIRVGVGPHGLAIWPQPGRYSLGHTGVLR